MLCLLEFDRDIRASGQVLSLVLDPVGETILPLGAHMRRMWLLELLLMMVQWVQMVRRLDLDLLVGRVFHYQGLLLLLLLLWYKLLLLLWLLLFL